MLRSLRADDGREDHEVRQVAFGRKTPEPERSELVHFSGLREACGARHVRSLLASMAQLTSANRRPRRGRRGCTGDLLASSRISCGPAEGRGSRDRTLLQEPRRDWPLACCGGPQQAHRRNEVEPSDTKADPAVAREMPWGLRREPRVDRTPKLRRGFMGHSPARGRRQRRTMTRASSLSGVARSLG